MGHQVGHDGEFDILRRPRGGEFNFYIFIYLFSFLYGILLRNAVHARVEYY